MPPLPPSATEPLVRSLSLGAVTSVLLAGCTTYSVHVRTFPPTESAQVLIVSGGLVIHLGAR